MYFIPHPIPHNFGIRDLPTPRELNKLVRYRSRASISLLHHSSDPFRVVITRSHFLRQEMVERFNLRLIGIGVKQDIVLGRLAVDALNRERESAEVIEIVVVIDNTVQVGCTAVKAFLDSRKSGPVLLRLNRAP